MPKKIDQETKQDLPHLLFKNYIIKKVDTCIKPDSCPIKILIGRYASTFLDAVESPNAEFRKVELMISSIKNST